ncbi:AAA family ATPase [Sphingomonas sp. LB-2]|uniref:ATP-binding protein n=1 Tax=Sphingomonas caeni TaxID=2984949 RepID=UPI00222F9D4A|nr:YhaN family protein [Sphingomonas caeni]MCW3848099.1 AAA family ATPase [Sphingomonas caeni]
MRFAELSLERYGRFEDSRLSLRAGPPDFHIIYGPNEAGKSTTLAAVSDLLFGIHARSPYNFRFEYPLMRIGAVIEEGGQRLAFRRRKTRELSLIDAQDQPIDEGLLSAMLHGLNRDTFASGFSLDQAGLRRGGEAMVKANDDLGQALFAAGSGLTGIARVQAAIDEEADAIWGRRAAARRSFTIAERQFDESMKTQRDTQLRPKEWADARANVARREDELGVLTQRQATLTAERRIVERLRRISAAMRQRASLLAALAERGEVIEFLQREEAQAEAALTALATATSERATAERLHKEAAERLAALSADAITELSEQIEALIERRGEMTKATIDRTRLEIELQGKEERAAILRVELGAGENIPSRLVVTSLRGIASRHAEATTGLRTREQALADVTARATPLREELADAVLAEGLDALRAAIAVARSLGDDFDERCAAGDTAADRAEAEAATAMAQLAPWAGDADALARLYQIDEPEIQVAHEARLRLANSLEKEITEQGRLDEELARSEAERARLAATGEAVSAEEVTEARTVRGALWQDIDAHLRDRERLPDPASAAGHFEAALAAADQVADRRYGTAQASARLAALDEHVAALALQRDQAAKRAGDMRAALETLHEEWRARLEAIALPALDPMQLRGWFAYRKTALDLHAAATDARLLAARNRERRADAMAALATAVGIASANVDGLAAALAVAEVERAKGETLERAFTEKRTRLAGYDEEIARLERQFVQDRRAVEGARSEWDVQQTALDLVLAIDDIEGRLALIDELRADLDAIRAHTQRIAGIVADQERFDADLIALAGQAGITPEADPSRTLDKLRTRLDAARSVAQTMADLAVELDRRGADVDTANHACDTATATLAPFLERVGLDAAAGLSALLDNSRERRDMRAGIEGAEREIVAEGDAYALADLVTAWEACDPDENANRAQAIDQELATLTDQITTAANSLGEARRIFAELDDRPQGAADALADAEAARAEMAAQVEIYILKRAQSLMLRWTMDRYRERRQDPLLARASALFSTLTLGRFVELKVDYETATPRLLGLRADREALVPIDGMSEGTTDQLFLALRLAAVEQSIASGVRMPFLADDLFVNFDDERAEAGLRVLTELANSTQVLFFTHHMHLQEIGRRVLTDGLLSECVLL